MDQANGDDFAADSCLGMFAKHWEPGKVKTRLGARIGKQAASEVYFAFLTTLTRSLADSAHRRVIAFDPPDRVAEFSRLAGKKWELTPQVPGMAFDHSQSDPGRSLDLGQRMSNFFHTQLALSSRVVLIGSDTPTVSAHEIEFALTQLSSHDVVLGPANDGGYWLIGMRRFIPQLFHDICWSTDSVYDRTVEVLARESVVWSKLAVRNDVDEWEDLRRLNDELSASTSFDAELQKVVARAIQEYS